MRQLEDFSVKDELSLCDSTFCGRALVCVEATVAAASQQSHHGRGDHGPPQQDDILIEAVLQCVDAGLLWCTFLNVFAGPKASGVTDTGAVEFLLQRLDQADDFFVNDVTVRVLLNP